MAKNVIRLTESKLKQIIEACVKETIENLEDEGVNEISNGLAKRAYDKMLSKGQIARARNLNSTYQDIYNDDDVQYDLSNNSLTLKGDGNNYMFRNGRTNQGYSIDKTGYLTTQDGRNTPMQTNITTDPRKARKFGQAVKNYHPETTLDKSSFRR